MSDQKHNDKQFYITFAIVLGFLGAFAVAIFIVANMVQEKSSSSIYPDKIAQRIDERTAPVGQVNTDANAALTSSAPAEAPGAKLSPKEVVAQVCSACHATGVLGAPKEHNKADWAGRGDINTLLKFAKSGKGNMPPRGGKPSLTDDQLKGAIEIMTTFN